MGFFYLSASMLASAFLRATTGPGNFRSADQLELADDLLDRHLGALSPGAHDLRDAGLNSKTFFTADSLAFPDILPFPLLSRHRLSADLLALLYLHAVDEQAEVASKRHTACLSCIFTRSAPFTVCETSATAAAVSAPCEFCQPAEGPVAARVRGVLFASSARRGA